jgi:nucleoside-diphosphate-sugar epimerase
MNILVVGGSGYVGGAVTDLLLESGHDVRVYDALLYEESYRKPVYFVRGDVRDRERMMPLLRWADVVVWLAALVGDPACSLNPEVTVQINQTSVEWLAEVYDGRIVFMSTCSVYGAQDGILVETSPTNPLSLYAVTKLAAEEALAGKNAIIFRLGTLFGVGDHFSRIRFDLVVNTLTLRAHKQGHLTVFGGEQFRPLLHVRDVASAIVSNVATDFTGIFNLHRQNVRIVDLAYQIRNHFPDVSIDQTEMKFQDTRNYRTSSDLAASVLGFRAACSIDDGIEEVKELLDTGRIRDTDNPRYINQLFLSAFSTHLEYGGSKSHD